jgi:hypothetical protein
MNFFAKTQKMSFDAPLRMQSGAFLKNYELAYETYGQLNDEKIKCSFNLSCVKRLSSRFWRIRRTSKTVRAGGSI